MKILISFLLAAILIINGTNLYSQTKKRDKAFLGEKKNEFLDEIKKEAKTFKSKNSPAKKSFLMDFSGMDLPTSTEQFNKYWFNQPVSQGLSGMCWCFSTTSYFESEINRLYNQKIKLSELFTVYWEYVEKARRFIRERGDSFFGEGSEANAVRRIWKHYGIVPSDAYTGLKQGQKFHDHSQMFAEMNNYLISVKANNSWNEEENLKTIKSILNHYIGEPPTSIMVNNEKLTPQEYLIKIVRLNLDDYFDIISLMEKPYFTKIEYNVPDNWWHDSDYYNVPLDVYMSIIKKSIRKGYTMPIGGDVSEPGYDSHFEAAIVPTFDIPSEYIDENSRQFRFTNGTTQDDHGIHLVGYNEKEGVDWYLIKDSGSGSRNGKNKGYYFYHEDYVKLKIIDFMVHKDMISDILSKF